MTKQLSEKSLSPGLNHGNNGDIGLIREFDEQAKQKQIDLFNEVVNKVSMVMGKISSGENRSLVLQQQEAFDRNKGASIAPMEAKFLKIPLTLSKEQDEFGGRESGPLIISAIKDTSSILI